MGLISTFKKFDRHKRNMKQFNFFSRKPKKAFQISSSNRPSWIVPMKPLFSRTHPWSDRDLDGSPNKFDCSPKNAAKDGMLGDIWEKAKSRILTKKGQKALRDIQATVKSVGVVGTQIARAGTTLVESPIARERRIAREAGRELRQRRISELTSEAAKARKNSAEYRQLQDALAKARLRAAKSEAVISERELKRGQKQQKAFISASSALAGLMLPRGTLPRNVVPQEKVSSASADSGVSQYERTYGRKTVAVPVRSKPGRPTGSYSLKHYIPGVGYVHVYEWRKWITKQKALKRLQGKPVEGETMTYDAETDTMVPVSEYQAQPGQMPVQRQVLPLHPAGQAMPSRQLTPLEQLRQQQLAEQQNDNVLNAPNIQRGEMVKQQLAPEPNILQAPNAFKGELRNIQQTRREMVEVGDKPISNPSGDEYLDINPISGQAVARRRVSERWLTGEAI